MRYALAEIQLNIELHSFLWCIRIILFPFSSVNNNLNPKVMMSNENNMGVSPITKCHETVEGGGLWNNFTE